jgi:hypothetical protein
MYNKVPSCDIDGVCIHVPYLFPENQDAIFVWSNTSDQLRPAGMDGAMFAPDHNAIWMFMDKFGIQNQCIVFQKVRALFTHFIGILAEKSERSNS